MMKSILDFGRTARLNASELTSRLNKALQLMRLDPFDADLIESVDGTLRHSASADYSNDNRT